MRKQKLSNAEIVEVLQILMENAEDGVTSSILNGCQVILSGFPHSLPPPGPKSPQNASQPRASYHSGQAPSSGSPHITDPQFGRSPSMPRPHVPPAVQHAHELPATQHAHVPPATQHAQPQVTDRSCPPPSQPWGQSERPTQRPMQWDDRSDRPIRDNLPPPAHAYTSNPPSRAPKGMINVQHPGPRYNSSFPMHPADVPPDGMQHVRPCMQMHGGRPNTPPSQFWEQPPRAMQAASRPEHSHPFEEPLHRHAYRSNSPQGVMNRQRPGQFQSSFDPRGSEEQKIWPTQSAAYEEEPRAPRPSTHQTHQTHQGMPVDPGQRFQSASPSPRQNRQESVDYANQTLSPGSFRCQKRQQSEEPGQGTRFPSSSKRPKQQLEDPGQQYLSPSSSKPKRRLQESLDLAQQTLAPGSSRQHMCLVEEEIGVPSTSLRSPRAAKSGLDKKGCKEALLTHMPRLTTAEKKKLLRRKKGEEKFHWNAARTQHLKAAMDKAGQNKDKLNAMMIKLATFFGEHNTKLGAMMVKLARVIDIKEDKVKNKVRRLKGKEASPTSPGQQQQPQHVQQQVNAPPPPCPTSPDKKFHWNPARTQLLKAAMDKAGEDKAQLSAMMVHMARVFDLKEDKVKSKVRRLKREEASPTSPGQQQQPLPQHVQQQVNAPPPPCFTSPVNAHLPSPRHVTASAAVAIPVRPPANRAGPSAIGRALSNKAPASSAHPVTNRAPASAWQPETKMAAMSAGWHPSLPGSFNVAVPWRSPYSTATQATTAPPAPGRQYVTAQPATAQQTTTASQADGRQYNMGPQATGQQYATAPQATARQATTGKQANGRQLTSQQRTIEAASDQQDDPGPHDFKVRPTPSGQRVQYDKGTHKRHIAALAARHGVVGAKWATLLAKRDVDTSQQILLDKKDTHPLGYGERLADYVFAVLEDISQVGSCAAVAEEIQSLNAKWMSTDDKDFTDQVRKIMRGKPEIFISDGMPSNKRIRTETKYSLPREHAAEDLRQRTKHLEQLQASRRAREQAEQEHDVPPRPHSLPWGIFPSMLASALVNGNVTRTAVQPTLPHSSKSSPLTAHCATALPHTAPQPDSHAAPHIPAASQSRSPTSAQQPDSPMPITHHPPPSAHLHHPHSLAATQRYSPYSPKPQSPQPTGPQPTSPRPTPNSHNTPAVHSPLPLTP
eukprot:gene1690-33087_t